MSMELAWNTQKNKITDVKGKEKEQERQGFIRNPEIDLEKTHLNYDLVISNLNLYQRVKKRIDKVKDVSRIQKNSVVNYSNIITINQDQFEEWGIDKSKEYFNEVYKYFCDEFGKENVVSAKVHLDETTPHMHLHFVPINKENGKLQARIVMDRKRINKIHTELPKYLQENNFDVVRGKGKTAEKNIKDIHEFKIKNLEKVEK
ncbi:MobV family relaxase, partial [Clostridium tarantellae]